MTETSPIWRPSAARQTASRMHAFAESVQRKYRYQGESGYWDLYRWSLQNPGLFWQSVADELGVIWQEPARVVYQPPPAGQMRGAKWFAGARLNFAQNLLGNPTDAIRITSIQEGCALRRLSGRALHNQVARCVHALKQSGVQPGDRVAGVMTNNAEAVIAMLATAALGAIWSSCSPDFGVNGIVDRLHQIQPKVLFYTAAYRYGGRLFDCRENIQQSLSRLPTVKTTVAVAAAELAEPQPGELTFEVFLTRSGLPPTDEAILAIPYVAMPFDHPLYILFSSGTTGVPKCIVHSAGGTLLQHKKELALHSDLKAGDKLLYYTTCGWMMWNWMVSALSVDVGLVLFDGAVTHPDMGVLWRILAQEKVAAFGTSPKFLATCKHLKIHPADMDLSALKTILSTGSPLLPEHYEWVYSHVGTDIHLASISGGTDIISCFMLGVPTLPVYKGEIQAPGLGMAVEAWDEEGHEVKQAKGELVCTQPFPSMPIGFWQDVTGEKFRDAYFSYYEAPEVWRHGDFIEVTEHGGIVVFGRSDATLNPGGVRIGTAEIYRQVENFAEIADSLAVSKDFAGDVAIWLFVKLAPGVTWDEDLQNRLKITIRENLTPRHVPKRIFPVQDIPYTRSGKKVEMAVRQAVHDQVIKNLDALANPECLAEYYEIGRGQP